MLTPLSPLPSGAFAPAPPRVNGAVGSTNALSGPQISIGRGQTVTLPAEPASPAGDISFDFTETDIREVVAEILTRTLRVNYVIDPTVRGTVTLKTTVPVARSQVLPALQAVLSQVGARLVQSAGLYRVVPAAAGAAAPGGTSVSDILAGATVVSLRYASADDLAKVLQPYVGPGARVVADPGRNVLLIGGEPAARETLAGLVRAFDIDVLAGQSYALFPIGNGSAKDFASALQDAFRGQAGGGLAGVVRVVPMERISSVLLISSQPRYIDEARRVFGLVDRVRRQTVRSWHVYYLQNGRSNDITYVLQQAFTPNNVTAQPSARPVGSTAPGRGSRTIESSGFGGGPGSGPGSGRGAGIGIGSGGGSAGGGGLGGSGLSSGGLGATAQAAPAQDPAQNPANPLFGGLDPAGGGNAAATSGGGTEVNALRIIPNPQNNAVLVYSTPQETETVEAMLRKIDIMPLQVRIDATIAEVSLNDALSYGTQFFFKAGINGALSFANPASAVAQAVGASGFSNPFPGFVLSGPDNGNAALTALQAVTEVKVLSSPQLLVLDNEAARLQVGALVPFLTSSSQSVISSNAPIVNSVDYRETGVIMQVTPRVNSGGLVTLDISQEVSDVDPSQQVPGIASPTFSQRTVTSRVVVQDGQTIGLAGLIRDNSSRSNQGIPFLKDIPLLGLLAGQQGNRRGRTELLVLVTPHVVHDQRDARALTEDLRDQVINAASVPDSLGRLRPSGLPDPAGPLRRTLRLGTVAPRLGRGAPFFGGSGRLCAAAGALDDGAALPDRHAHRDRRADRGAACRQHTRCGHHGGCGGRRRPGSGVPATGRATAPLAGSGNGSPRGSARGGSHGPGRERGGPGQSKSGIGGAARRAAAGGGGRHAVRSRYCGGHRGVAVPGRVHGHGRACLPDGRVGIRPAGRTVPQSR